MRSIIIFFPFCGGTDTAVSVIIFCFLNFNISCCFIVKILILVSFKSDSMRQIMLYVQNIDAVAVGKEPQLLICTSSILGVICYVHREILAAHECPTEHYPLRTILYDP